MRHAESAFAGHHGAELYWQCWRPEADAAASLIIVHGFGEHSGRYRHVTEAASSARIAVYAFDHRGHGKSPGRRGHIDDMADYRGDIAAFVNLVSADKPNLPIFMWGHSMGSLIVLDYAIRQPEKLRSVITSGVGLEPAGVATPLVVFIARSFARFWPTFPMTIPVEPANLSRDAAEVADYESDRLVHKKASARWAVSMLDAIAWIKAHAGDLRVPILMLHGAADPINLPSGSRNFFAGIGIQDKELKLYPDCLHVLHGELNRDEVIGDLLQWILDHPRSAA